MCHWLCRVHVSPTAWARPRPPQHAARAALHNAVTSHRLTSRPQRATHSRWCATDLPIMECATASAATLLRARPELTHMMRVPPAAIPKPSPPAPSPQPAPRTPLLPRLTPSRAPPSPSLPPRLRHRVVPCAVPPAGVRWHHATAREAQRRASAAWSSRKQTPALHLLPARPPTPATTGVRATRACVVSARLVFDSGGTPPAESSRLQHARLVECRETAPPYAGGGHGPLRYRGLRGASFK